MDLDALDLPALADAADVSTRTVRYYIAQGLIPAPEARGPGAHYTREHLDRLRLVKRLQREHLPLAEIRRRLAALSADEIRQLAERPEPKARASSAKDYIRQVMSGGRATMEDAKPAAAPPSFVVRSHTPLGPHREPAAEYSTTTPPARAQYDRLTLTPDIELHVRRPLSRNANRQLERLLQAARAIFEEETP